MSSAAVGKIIVGLAEVRTSFTLIFLELLSSCVNYFCSLLFLVGGLLGPDGRVPQGKHGMPLGHVV